jgi:hypothetical protein
MEIEFGLWNGRIWFRISGGNIGFLFMIFTSLSVDSFYVLLVVI